MRVRDAVEADAAALAAMVETPPDVMCDVIHDRTVRVAELDAADAAGESAPGDVSDGSDAERDADGEGDEERPVVGFVSFDAEREEVYVTHLDGDRAAISTLLDEPVRFARKEGMAVEVVVPEPSGDLRDVVEEFGFARAGDGPQFDGTPTHRYRFTGTSGG